MSRKLYDKPKPEKTVLAYADLQSVEHCTLKFSRHHQKQANFSGASEDDELIKYMSNLPGYLERGKNIHEKVLNVGVLDWSCLEQWQHRHKHIPQKGKRTLRSSSDSNPSSSVPAEGLSDHSGGGRSQSPCQRLSRPSLQSYFMASTMKDHSLGDKSSGENVGNCHNLRGSPGNSNAQSKLVRADEYLSQNLHVRRLKARSKKDLYPNINTENKILPSDKKCGGASCAKLEKGIQDGELGKRMETLQEANLKAVEQGATGKSKPIDLPLPNKIPQNSHFGVSDTRTSFGQKSGTTKRTSFSEKSKELFLKDFNCDISHSCLLPDEIEAKHSKAEGSSSLDAGNIRIPTATSSAPLSSKMGTSPSRSRKGEERKQTGAAVSSANGPPQGLGQKGKPEKLLSSSSFGRFGISMGYSSKGSSCKESLYVPHKNSMPSVGSSSETARGSTSSCASGRNNSLDAVRSRTSPLRRLLDPLLKPKEANGRLSMELSQKESGFINNADIDYPHLQPRKELNRDRRVSCSSINTRDSSREKKLVSSTVRALLRIAVKNGHPFFTFAVDNDNNILAATVKTLSTPGKDDCCCIYTFFSFREVKKKNGSWMNQAGKSKGPNYIHQVVAQMKVSNSHSYDLTGQNCVDFSTVKEFVLFSVELKQGNGEAFDYQPNDELAAIVLKIPKATSFFNNLHQGSCRNDTRLVHATVVLPSGVHSLPSRGGPSSLIERWKSGGSCDCGGWDLGCKLKILENGNESCRNSKPSKAYLAEQFELFLQVNGQDHVPGFSLIPITHGIYSVAFDSSLSLLQAFSICIALMDSKMPHELSGSRNPVEGKTPRETLSMQNDGIKVLRKLEDIPAIYISYPPLSPVGRV
ncbi:uncharacterized protein LOC129313711 [Prosopis cineraria]|uniref:uncharacterized protein LOC129313711 n=1 Tax=Prosopis cineraria TaxID=364024 RepID=UPI00240FB9E5|nr:uncharacterized protein LOC129313711 [Prosopis cineraria]XP_054813006.1 uncharacterized protein LOC129313711 [Prosopis cineraria]